MTQAAPSRDANTEPRIEASVQTPPIERAPAPEDYDSAPPIASPFHAAAVQPVPPVTVAPIEPVFSPVDAQTELKPPPRPAATPRPIPELPPVSLTLPPDSGLELVETKFKTAPMAEPEAPVPRRVRPPKVAVVEEPLQIVETQRTQLPPTS